MKTLAWQNRAPKTQNNFFSISVWLVSGSFCALDDAKSPRPLKILSSLVSPLLVSSLFYFIGPKACLFILLLRAHTAFPFFSAQTAYCENLSWGNVSSDCADIYLRVYLCILTWLSVYCLADASLCPHRAALRSRPVLAVHWTDFALCHHFYSLFLDGGQRCQGVTFKRLSSLCGIWVNKGGLNFAAPCVCVHNSYIYI